MFKQHSIYIFVGIVVVAILLLTFNYILITCFKPKYIPAEYWIPETLMKKDIISKNAKKNKIIIISGSNALFGVSSLTLKERTSKDVLNLAIHAGLPIDFLINTARQYAKAGDIIIMPLEYAYLSRESSPSQWEVEQFTTWGRSYFDTFPAFRKFQIIAKSTRYLPRRIMNITKQIPVKSMDVIQLMNNSKIITEKAYAVEHLNSFGEFFVDASPTQHTLEMKNTGIGYGIPDMPSNDFLEKMANATTEFEHNGISLFLTYPPSIKNKKLDTNNIEHMAKIQKIYTTISSYGIKVFGNAHKYNIDVSNFYDTPDHLNAKGATLRTLFMADDLQNILTDTYTLQSPIADYLSAKNNDALRILNDYKQRDNARDQ